MTDFAKSKDRLAGALTAVTGAMAAIEGYHYQIGSFSDMGPGFFPFVLGCILMFLGLLIAANRGCDSLDETSAMPPLDIRGAGCIVGSIVSFLIVVRYGGLLPAAFCATVVAAVGDRDAKPIGTIALGFVAVVIGLVLFHGVLKLPLPLFSWG